MTDSRWPIYRKRAIRVAVAMVCIWFLLDAIYAGYCQIMLSSWEKGNSRDSQGVLQDCDAFSLGEGDVAILLLHGINETPFTYRSMAEVLGKHHHVRAMRLPGFGEPVPEYSASDLEQWVAAVKREALELRRQHSRVIIVAHSLGGAITIQCILRAGPKQAELFDAVVLMAPAIAVSSRRSPILPVESWHSLSNGLVFTRFTHSPFPPDTKDPALADFPNRTPFTPRSVIADTFRLTKLNRDRAADFSLPVLMVLSEQDEVIDHEAAAQWFEKLPSPQKRLYWNNQAGHQLQYDIGWEEVADQILQFVQTTGATNVAEPAAAVSEESTNPPR